VFQRVAGETMVVHLAAGDQTFERQNVTEILAKREGHRGRHAAIGLLVGAGAGLGIGAGYDARDSNKYWFPNFGKGVLTPVGAMAGAAIGALLPGGGWK